jgi:hypothetical protein
MAGKKAAANRLEIAQAALEDCKQKCAELEGKRREALLADNDAQAARLGTAIEEQRRLADVHRDKIALLEQEAAREARERQVRERRGLIERIEAKLAERDKAGAELVEAIKAADAAFIKMVDLGRDIGAAWPWPSHDMAPIMIGPGPIHGAIEAELYRLTARPFLGGGQPETKHAGLKFPGAKSPRLEWMGVPDRITPLADVLASASGLASSIMRDGRGSADKPVEPAAPQPATNGHSEPQPQSPAQANLNKLLGEMARAAEDPTPEGEQRYQRLVAQVAEAQQQLTLEGM